MMSNSSLGAFFALLKIFRISQTQSLVSILKIFKNTKLPPQIIELFMGKLSSLRGESSAYNPSLWGESQELHSISSLRELRSNSWQSKSRESKTQTNINIFTKIFFAFLFVLTLTHANEFAPNKNHAINIVTENDAYFEPFIKSDKYYTGGHYVSYLSPEFAQSWLNKIAGFAHLYDRHFTRFAVALKQELYTPNKPRDYDFTAPSNDILFGAGLYGSLAIISRTRDFMEQFSLDIGVVGPLAYGKETQNLIHKATKNPIYRGWDAPNGTLKNEVLINLHYGLIWRWVFIEDFFDVLPSVQISLGNALTAANVGIKFRIGYGIKNDFGLQKLRSRFAQNIISDGLKVYVFFGASGSAVARDMFVQGNTSALTRGAGVKSGVKLNRFLYEIELGAMVGWKYLSFGYVWSNESKRFREQNGHHKYGSLRLEIMF